MNIENSKTNEPHRFRFALPDKLILKDSNKNMALANISIYHKWKNIKSAYTNNKFRISAPTWNEFFFKDFFFFFKFAHKKNKTKIYNI